MEKLEQIKENIRTINPLFTDEVLDLLYEYATTRFSKELNESVESIRNNDELQDYINSATCNIVGQSTSNS